ncbi:MAG: zf-HC2 domain-containing protein [Lachnospiraceae bacterium]|nr:zf-HC2 domain-containing protein [Lachnospiraceae bacterium]
MKYSCDFIGDLLPLYVENIAERKTMNLVEEHLEQCPECARQIGYMKEDLFKIRSFEQGVTFFKKDIRRNILSYIVWAVFILICAFCVGYEMLVHHLSEIHLITFREYNINDAGILFIYVLIPVCSFIGAIALGTERSLWKLLAPIGFFIGAVIVFLGVDITVLQDADEFLAVLSLEGILVGDVSAVGLMIGIIIRAIRKQYRWGRCPVSRNKGDKYN